MILVLLEVNGEMKVLQRASYLDAQKDVKPLVEEAKKHYPNKVFTPRYFLAEEL